MKQFLVDYAVSIFAGIVTIYFGLLMLQPTQRLCESGTIADLSHKLGTDSDSSSFVAAVMTNDGTRIADVEANDFYLLKTGDQANVCDIKGSWIPYNLNTIVERIER